MGATLLSNGTLLVDDELRAEANEAISQAHDRRVVRVTMTLEDGERIELPEDASDAVVHVLHGLSRGVMSVSNFPEVLTSTVAADLLGVSRPTLMKLVREGVLPSHRVGSHHRFSTGDVIELASTRQRERSEAFAELRAWDEQNPGSE